MSGFSSWALPRCIRLQLLLMNFCSLASAFSFATVHPARYGSLNKARLGANSGFHGVSFPGKCGNNLRACTQVASRQSEALFGLINTKADRRVSASRATRTSTNIPLNVVKTSPRYKTQTPETRGVRTNLPPTLNSTAFLDVLGAQPPRKFSPPSLKPQFRLLVGML